MKDIALFKDNDIADQLMTRNPEHKEMVKEIADFLPEVKRATSMFDKRQSQFMDNMLTVTQPTPIRRIRQMLSEMSRTRDAIKETYFRVERRKLDVKQTERDLSSVECLIQRERLELDLLEAYSDINRAEELSSGSIRKLANHTTEMKSIMETMNIKDLSEVDFEAEEERYHIMTAFTQGMEAARASRGMIDQGNQIYFMQLGINGGVAQQEVLKYFKREEEAYKDGSEPTHEMTLVFLNEMAEKFKGCSKVYAKHKGMTGEINEMAALKIGDTRLIKGE